MVLPVVSSVPGGEMDEIDEAGRDVLVVAGRAATPGWMNRAACRSYPGWWWFTASTRRRAIRICGRCPVRVECLTYALDGDERNGVWGGLTVEARERAALSPALCGVGVVQKLRRFEYEPLREILLAAHATGLGDSPLVAAATQRLMALSQAAEISAGR